MPGVIKYPAVSCALVLFAHAARNRFWHISLKHIFKWVISTHITVCQYGISLPDLTIFRTGN